MIEQKGIGREDRFRLQQFRWINRGTSMKPFASISRGMRSQALVVSMVFAIASVVYAQNSIAGHHEGHHGHSGAEAGKSSSSQGGSGGQNGAKHKKHGDKKHGDPASGQSSSGQSGSSPKPVTESQRTGVTGNDPSGGRSETSGQERGPSGY